MYPTSSILNSSPCEFKYTVSSKALNNHQREFYEHNGYIVIKNVLSSEEINIYTDRFLDIINKKVIVPKGLLEIEDYSLSQEGKTDGVYLYYKVHNFLYDDILSQYASNKKIIGVIQSIIGDNITATFSIVFNKPPNAHEDSSKHVLHQDLYNFPFRPAEKICASWTALEKVYKENGCLFVVPGTHKFDLYPHRQINAMNNRYLHGVLGFDHLEKVYLEMDKGDTVFFHPLLMHGSGPNLTNGFRRSISVHYANSDCYFIDVGDTAQNLLRKQLDTMMFKLVGYGYYDTFKFNSKIIHGPFGKFQQVQNKL